MDEDQKLLPVTSRTISCEDCHIRYKLGVCVKCENRFSLSDAVYITKDGKKFHNSCFLCHGCSGDMNGIYFQKSDKFFCVTCNDKDVPICMTCGIKIKDSAENGRKTVFVRIGQKSCHKECLVCKVHEFLISPLFMVA